jgi:uncharacterized membrane protein
MDRLEFIASIAAAGAAVLALLIARKSMGAGGLPGCGAESACEAVARSRWAKIGRIPVAMPAALLYAAMFAAMLSGIAPAWATPLLWYIGIVSACTALGAAAWFLVLQAVVVRRFCLYCVAVHFLAAVAALILLLRSPPDTHASIAILLGVASLLAILVGGQLFIRVPTFEIVSVAAPARTVAPQETKPPAPRFTAPMPAIQRRVSLFKGNVELDLQDWPLLGRPDAEHVIGWLFDHTCAECHHEHGVLRKVLPMFAGELAIVAVPVPMFPDCNPEAKHRYENRVQACAYARLCWAVWLSAPGVYDDWDAFMAQGQAPQPFGLALRKAQSLADLGRFNIRSGDDILNDKVATGVEVYRRSRANILPVLLMPRGIGRGHISTADELYSALREHLPPRATSGATSL